MNNAEIARETVQAMKWQDSSFQYTHELVEIVLAALDTKDANAASEILTALKAAQRSRNENP